MSAEQKFNLAKMIIVATAIAISAVAIIWLMVIHNPSSMKTIINFSDQIVEVDCTFYNQDEYLENETPCK